VFALELLRTINVGEELISVTVTAPKPTNVRMLPTVTPVPDARTKLA
jgi:hypothetical protein